MDDFVVSQFLFGDASNITVPIKLYNAVRAAPTPALNALATLLLVGSFIALGLAYVGLARAQTAETAQLSTSSPVSRAPEPFDGSLSPGGSQDPQANQQGGRP